MNSEKKDVTFANVRCRLTMATLPTGSFRSDERTPGYTVSERRVTTCRIRVTPNAAPAKHTGVHGDSDEASHRHASAPTAASASADGCAWRGAVRPHGGPRP